MLYFFYARNCNKSMFVDGESNVLPNALEFLVYTVHASTSKNDYHFK